MVKLQDIYDEFNHGQPHPRALRDFIAYAASNWIISPDYIVLAGAGSFDYLDYKGYGEAILPVHLVKTPNGIYASDGWFTDLDDDGAADIPIGRLPVLTALELDAYIDRIITYETADSPAWARQLLIVTDNNDKAGNFHAGGAALKSDVTPRFTASHLSLQTTSLTSVRQLLFSDLADGVGYLNYFGHAGMATLADEQILTTDDVDALSNAPRRPIVTLMGCAAGNFEYPGYDCLAEHLVLNPDGGAIAVWAPSGWVENRFSEELAEVFYQTVARDRARPLGDAIQTAVTAFSQRRQTRYVTQVYNLLGDPALKSITNDNQPPSRLKRATLFRFY